MESGYIYVHDNIFPTLLAISEDEQSNGLMGKAWPPPVMSFVYSKPQFNRFWMKNTPSPLDIVFCQNGKVAEICKGEPHSTAMIGNILSDLVVEFPHGTVAASGIQVGHEVGLVKPTLAELKVIVARKYHGIVKI